LIYLLEKTSSKLAKVHATRQIHRLLWLALGLTVIQVILGTQVRQFVDNQIDEMGEQAKALWLSKPTVQFYIHRSLSILVILFNGWLAFQIFSKKLSLTKIYWVLILIGVEIMTGIAMYYLDFPFGSQPIHLVLASLLFGLQFYLVLETQKNRTTIETL
jgi:cytochrome c oxidase assembly protein subunit 15